MSETTIKREYFEDDSQHLSTNSTNKTSYVKHEPSVEYLLILPSSEAKDEVPNPIKIKMEEDLTSLAVNVEMLKFEKNAKQMFKKVSICRKCPEVIVFSSCKLLKEHLKKVSHFTCKHCGLCFQSTEGIDGHKCIPRKNVKFRCDFCPKEFSYFKGYEQHIEIHFDEKKYTCDICGKKLVGKRMSQHMRVTHGETKFKCDLCPRKFKVLVQIKAHMKTHLKPWSCKICHKKFSESRYFSEHVLGHENQNPFSCKICDSSYTRKTSLWRHMKTAHSEARNFPCSECKYRGKTQDDLTTHQKSHSKAYKCDVCGKKYSRSSMLREHRVLHDNPNAYQCKICKTRYTEKKAMKNHIKRVHVWE